MSEDKNSHYYLVAGLVMFRDKEENIHQVTVNCMLAWKTKNLPVRAIGRAQQLLQFQFHQQMEDAEMQPFNVAILGMTYLGYMTEREFHHRPEGEAEVVSTLADKVMAN